MNVHPIPVLSRRVERRTFTCSHGIEGQWDGACTECKTLSEKVEAERERQRQKARTYYEKKKAEQNQSPSTGRIDTPSVTDNAFAEGAEAPSGVNNPERAPAETPEAPPARSLIYRALVDGLSFVLSSPWGRQLSNAFLREVFEEFLSNRKGVRHD